MRLVWARVDAGADSRCNAFRSGPLHPHSARRPPCALSPRSFGGRACRDSPPTAARARALARRLDAPSHRRAPARLGLVGRGGVSVAVGPQIAAAMSRPPERRTRSVAPSARQTEIRASSAVTGRPDLPVKDLPDECWRLIFSLVLFSPAKGRPYHWSMNSTRAVRLLGLSRRLHPIAQAVCDSCVSSTVPC